MVVPELAEVPLTVPEAVEAVHAKLAPEGTEVRAILVAVPEQIACEEGVAVRTGSGLAVTDPAKTLMLWQLPLSQAA